MLMTFARSMALARLVSLVRLVVFLYGSSRHHDIFAIRATRHDQFLFTWFLHVCGQRDSAYLRRRPSWASGTPSRGTRSTVDAPGQLLSGKLAGNRHP